MVIQHELNRAELHQLPHTAVREPTGGQGENMQREKLLKIKYEL